eukprot:CAMPEP_0174907080 /NCGR_PEP_ID=MMETSP0167-20121228/59538_1 /TAXON_ID=38298 /ORGANISM="Rhodella maculata, Strain CCMP736" /LENGTH=236 /DNA_ID=CAMNT_0016150473 /DNA_START=349 /DNA_END=1056 /DNA_ORIENTATION=+
MVLLEAFGPSLWLANGPQVYFFKFPFPTRMAVAQLPPDDDNGDDGLWVWSPTVLTPELAEEVAALGTPRHIVSPNRFHNLFLKEWHERWPEAKLLAPPGLAKHRSDLQFEPDELGDVSHPAWAAVIDQVVFRGSFALEEVVFFHRPSRTAIFGDLVLRLDPAAATGLKGWIMRMVGVVGEEGSTPRDLRMTFFRREPTRAARDRVLRTWAPEQLLIAHGACVREGATPILERALSW